MNVQLKLAGKENANIIKNMYPLYLHDISEHYENTPNEYGIYEDEPIKTLAEQYDIQNIWFEKPEELFPFLIMVDDKPAGFALIASKQFAPPTTDYYVNEFFILRPYRGKGLSQIAAKKVFDKFSGRWELYTNHLPKNIIGQKFWRNTIHEYTDNDIFEEIGDTFHGTKTIFRFKND